MIPSINVDDEGIDQRSSFYFEYASASIWIKCIGCQSVYRLGRQCDEASLPKQSRNLRNILWIISINCRQDIMKFQIGCLLSRSLN